MIEKRTMTCITCPIGCEMTVEFDGKNLIWVSGNTCKRGEKYASDEIQNPRRTLTSTITVFNNKTVKYLPVKTSSPIAKDKIFEAMKIINSIKADMPVKMGDVLYRDFTEDGIDIVACKDVLL